MYDLVLVNGTVVSPRETVPRDVLVRNGRIAALAPPGGKYPAARSIDVSGLYILPGLIDAHVHFRDPGLTGKEDFQTGSLAAAHGGVTTVLDMPNVIPPTVDPGALRFRQETVAGRSYTDYGLIAALTAGNLDCLQALAAAGAAAFKVFLGETTGQLPAPGDGALREAFRRIALTGLRCAVHAENRAIVDFCTAHLRACDRSDPAAYTESRPAVAEAEAVSRALLLAREAGCPVHICHLSSREGLEQVRRWREAGADVTAETAPHYLLLDLRHFTRRGAPLKVNPPLRDPAHRRALWEGLRDGAIDLVATDHAPHLPAEKAGPDIWRAAAGLSGVETAAPLLLTQVHRGRLTLNRLVELMAEGPARAFGLYPRKGALLPGSDADMTVVDLDAAKVLRASGLHGKSRAFPYEGWRVRGLPVLTLLRGEPVLSGGTVAGKPRGHMITPGGT